MSFYASLGAPPERRNDWKRTGMRALAVDIGTGTQDILLWDTDGPVENAVQLVMPSPTMRVAKAVRAATARGQGIALSGTLMGGGPCHWAVNDHLAAGYPVWATEAAARTFDDDLDRVRDMGVTLITADELRCGDDIQTIRMGDLDLEAIRRACRAFEAEPEFDVLAVAVFDHGNAPPRVSDRRFRFDYLASRLAHGGWLTDLGFERAVIPPEMTRLQAVAGTAPIDIPLLVMDTAPAAILGALDDPRVQEREDLVVVNVGNFHALAFHLQGRCIRGLFEHHTGEVTANQLMGYIERLGAGVITNDEIFNSQGHGALVLDPAPAHDLFLATTGPRQALLNALARPYHAVPHGAMMQAGCFGLLRAVAAKLPQFREAIEVGLAR
jgi:uncharacterized protein (DUF1786 family)